MIKTMKNIEMVTAVNGLQAFIEKDKDVPVTVSVAISANMKTLLEELRPYDEARLKLMKKDAKNDEFVELLSAEADVNIRMVNIENISTLNISTKDLMAMEFMLTVPEDENS